MKKIVISAKFQRDVPSKEKEKIIRRTLAFSSEITGLPENKFEVTTREGCWEILVSAVLSAAATAVIDKAITFTKERLNHMKKENNEIEQNNKAIDKQIEKVSIDPKIYKHAISLYDEIYIHKLRIAKFKEDGNVGLVEIEKIKNEKILTLIEFESHDDYEKYINK